MNKSILALAGFSFAAGIVLFVVVEPLLHSEPKATPPLAAMIGQPTPQAKTPLPSEPSEAKGVPARTSSDPEAVKSGTLFQYTNWGMSPAELERIGAGNITRTSPDRLFPEDYRKDGSRGTALDVNAEVLLESGYNTDGIFYDAIYYFNSNRLFLVTLVPHSIEDGIKTGRLLDGIYGAPEAAELSGRDVGSTGCILRTRWRSPREGKLITFFNKCGTRFEVRYEPIPSGL